MQPGSSIMPGKVNPSIPGDGEPGLLPGDGLRCHRRRGGRRRAARAERDDAGHRLERAARATILAAAIVRARPRRTVEGIEADEDRCRELLDRSTAMATALSPYIGYAATAEVAKAAVATGRSMREIVLERKLLDAARLDEILSAEAMTQPGIAGQHPMSRRRLKARRRHGAPMAAVLLAATLAAPLVRRSRTAAAGCFQSRRARACSKDPTETRGRSPI